jgi:hypothetical protein
MMLECEKSAGFHRALTESTCQSWRSSAALQNVRLSRRSLVRRRMLSVQSAVKSFLLFLAEFLESGIAAQRVLNGIEPKKGRRDGHSVVIQPTIGRRNNLVRFEIAGLFSLKIV